MKRKKDEEKRCIRGKQRERDRERQKEKKEVHTLSDYMRKIIVYKGAKGAKEKKFRCSLSFLVSFFISFFLFFLAPLTIFLLRHAISRWSIFPLIDINMIWFIPLLLSFFSFSFSLFITFPFLRFVQIGTSRKCISKPES